MTTELDMPESVESAVRTTPEANPAKEATKLAAAAALEGEESEPANEPQREGSTAITIRLLKPVEDSVSSFAGQSGETYDAYVDTSGATWVPLQAGDIMLEAEEFEVVEPVQVAVTSEAQQATASEAATVTPAQATPQTHEDAEARRRNYLREKDVLQEQIAALAIEQLKLREQVKLCKKESEVLVERLNNLIDDWEHPAPVQQSAETQPQQPAETATAMPAEPPSSSQSEPTQTYQSVLESEPIAVLGLKETAAAKLTEVGVETLWQLEMLRKDISDGRKEWPKGIGKAKVTMIEDAILAWCAANSGRWDRLQGANDAAEAAADEERAEAVKESQPSQPAVSSNIEDL